jgi:ketosteroid isomerase-like protein
MKRLSLYLLVLLLAAAACQRGPTPEQIILSQPGLAASGDLEGMLALFAEDINYRMSGFSPQPMQISGKAELRDWISEQFANHLRLEISVTSAEGDTVKTKTSFISDSLAAMGIDELTCDEVYVVQDGLITDWSCTLTEESADVFMAAVQALEEASQPPKIMATFDGNNCLVEGPDTVAAGRVFFGLDNQSDSTARVGLSKVNEGLSAADVLASMIPGSSEIPAGVTLFSGTNAVLAGTILDQYAIDLEPGEYILACAYMYTNEVYPGIGILVTE